MCVHALLIILKDAVSVILNNDDDDDLTQQGLLYVQENDLPQHLIILWDDHFATDS